MAEVIPGSLETGKLTDETCKCRFEIALAAGYPGNLGCFLTLDRPWLSDVRRVDLG